MRAVTIIDPIDFLSERDFPRSMMDETPS